MKIITRQYRHFKGGYYQVYGEILPLPAQLQTTVFRFMAKNADNQSDVAIIVTDKGMFYETAGNSSMVLYKSEETDIWWIRPFYEFHGDKTHTNGDTQKRFELIDARKVFYTDAFLARIE